MSAALQPEPHPDKNKLYYGDNLEVLRTYLPDSSVDLIYLDPPFNSRQDYNVLFAEKDGSRSASQITAFKDSWEWNLEAERSYQEVVERSDRVADAMRAFRTLLGGSDMLAYLAMMAPRLIELRRVLKPTGSIYLHCDPTASHYLKILMDCVFGTTAFGAETIWKRTNARGTAANWPHIHDTILYYRNGPSALFHSLKTKADKGKTPHTLITGADGLKYQTFELTGPGITREGESGRPWLGFDPNSFGRHWANSITDRNGWNEAGLIHWPKSQGFPRRRAAEPFDVDAREVTVGDVWTDIDRINQAAKERLRYPTQKPEALLERILRASSNEGDIVLDPFCGCGTTVQVAQKLNRRWIGIDITHLAIGLIKKRLADTFGLAIRETYQVIGEPKDLAGARQLASENRFQFENWALGLVYARKSEPKKGADRGVDGRKLFHDDRSGQTRQMLLSVKSGHVDVTMIRDLRGAMERESAEFGIFITLEPPSKPMLREAAEAGFYTSPLGGKFARMQIFTIKDLQAGATIDHKELYDVTLRTAPRHKASKAQNLNLALTDLH